MMAGREEKGGFTSFARGSELWMHQARLLGVAVLSVVGVSVVVGIVAAVAFFYGITSADTRYALERYVTANARLVVAMTNTKMELYVSGAPAMLEVADVAMLTKEDADEGLRILRNSGVLAALVTLGTFFFIGIYWIQYGRGKMTDQKLRGASLVAGPELRQLILSRKEDSPYSIAGVPMRKKSENLHMLVAGAQGVGKSQLFFATMKQVRARGVRAIVYDPSGEFTEAFYRPGKDILMNPLDARSPNWNIWNEIERDYHFDTMANGLIPDPAEADPFWAKAGRMVLKDVYKVLGRSGRRTNRDLYNTVARSNLAEMYALLQGEAGQTFVDPVTERTGMSLKMTVQNQLEAFRFLHDQGEPFSIRKWVQDENTDSWMFITCNEEMRQALVPVLSLWIDTAMKAVLSLPPVHKERLWFMLDELPTLQKLDILKLALTNTRKYGLCCMLGVQDFSQLYEIYGRELAKTIISGCQTKVLLRVTDGEAAKLMADAMGEAEVDEKEETLSYGLAANRDGVSVFSKRNLRDIVLSSEILTLPDMTGYLLIPGDYPVGKIRYEYVPTPKISKGFEERVGFGVTFGGSGPAAGTAAPASAATPAPAPAAAIVTSRGDLVDADSGEVLGQAGEAVSRAKVEDEPPEAAENDGADRVVIDADSGAVIGTRADVEAQGGASPPKNPLADAL